MFLANKTVKKYNEIYVFNLNTKNARCCRDPPNVPCSAERSGEGSVIFNEFSVPLFKGGNREGMENLYFPQFFYYPTRKI